jgi:hypothetical protein
MDHAPQSLERSAMASMRAKYLKRPLTRSASFLGRLSRILGVLLILSAGFDIYLFFRHTNRLAVPSWVFIIGCILTFAFCIIGYFGTTLYDGTLTTCFILFMVMKSLLTLWEVGLVFIYNMFIVDHALSLANFVSSFAVLAVSVWFAVVLHAYGPPPADDTSFSAFVI